MAITYELPQAKSLPKILPYITNFFNKKYMDACAGVYDICTANTGNWKYNLVPAVL